MDKYNSSKLTIYTKGQSEVREAMEEGKRKQSDGLKRRGIL